MTLRKLTLLSFIGMAFSFLAPTKGMASYSSAITAPTNHFTTYPASSLSCTGWVDWSWWWDDAPAFVEVTLYDGFGNWKSAYGTTSFGSSSLTWGAFVPTTGLTPKMIPPGQPLVDEASLIARPQDANFGYFTNTGAVCQITGHISV